MPALACICNACVKQLETRLVPCCRCANLMIDEGLRVPEDTKRICRFCVPVPKIVASTTPETASSRSTTGPKTWTACVEESQRPDSPTTKALRLIVERWQRKKDLLRILRRSEEAHNARQLKRAFRETLADDEVEHLAKRMCFGTVLSKETTAFDILVCHPIFRN